MNEISRSKWSVVEYSKTQINRAGKLISNITADKDSSEYIQALNIIDNWRSSHSYPLQLLYKQVKRTALDGDEVIVSQRLKRLTSIINKLSRFPDMSLTRMQDLGGCRMILPSVNEVYNIMHRMTTSKIRHELIREYDYITNPQKSGYRSYHLVYKYKSTSTAKSVYDNMQIEIQYRSKLQHMWATTVETMEVITGQHLKSGYGDKSLLRFFTLISSLFALIEGTATIPNTPTDYNKIISEVRTIDKKYNYLDYIRNFTVAVRYYHISAIKKTSGYYLLVMNNKTLELEIRYFKPSDISFATKQYMDYEKGRINKNINAVLVRGESLKMLEYAYPNYFPNNSEFIMQIENLIK